MSIFENKLTMFACILSIISFLFISVFYQGQLIVHQAELTLKTRKKNC